MRSILCLFVAIFLAFSAQASAHDSEATAELEARLSYAERLLMQTHIRGYVTFAYLQSQLSMRANNDKEAAEWLCLYDQSGILYEMAVAGDLLSLEDHMPLLYDAIEECEQAKPEGKLKKMLKKISAVISDFNRLSLETLNSSTGGGNQ